MKELDKVEKDDILICKDPQKYEEILSVAGVSNDKAVVVYADDKATGKIRSMDVLNKFFMMTRG